MRARRRGPALGAALLTTTLLAGCASSEAGAEDDAACASPTLTWEQDSARAGDVVAVHGEDMLTGCDDTGSEGATSSPMAVVHARLLVDDEAHRPEPAVPEPLEAAADGTFTMQVAVPAEVRPGSSVQVELTDRDGAAVRSGALDVVE